MSSLSAFGGRTGLPPQVRGPRGQRESGQEHGRREKPRTLTASAAPRIEGWRAADGFSASSFSPSSSSSSFARHQSIHAPDTSRASAWPERPPSPNSRGWPERSRCLDTSIQRSPARVGRRADGSSAPPQPPDRRVAFASALDSGLKTEVAALGAAADQAGGLGELQNLGLALQQLR